MHSNRDCDRKAESDTAADVDVEAHTDTNTET